MAQSAQTLGVALLLCAGAATSSGESRGGPPIIWDGEAGDGQFFNPMNWDPDSLPGPNDEALINMGGTINFFDVSAFLTAFNTMDPIADFNDDGMFNFFDVSAFLTTYNAGCP